MAEQNQALIVQPGREILPQAADWSTMCQMADVLFKSQLLPKHIQTWQAAVAVIQKGKELGIPPMYALSNIIVVATSGKPAANAELMLALIYRDHGDEAIRFVATTNDLCTISYKRRGWSTREEYTFTMADAKLAGLWGAANNYAKYGAAMLRARCISAVARMAFPDTIGGMHTPEEMGAEVQIDEEGGIEVTNAFATPITPDPARPIDTLDEPATEKMWRVMRAKVTALGGEYVLPTAMNQRDAWAHLGTLDELLNAAKQQQEKDAQELAEVL